MLDTLIDHIIVIDTPYSLQYIGKLTAYDDMFLELTDVDVHDNNDSRTTKEMYLMEAKRDLIKINRKQVLVKQNAVISISKLNDILVF